MGAGYAVVVKGGGWCMCGTKLLHRTKLMNTVCTLAALLESIATTQQEIHVWVPVTALKALKAV